MENTEANGALLAKVTNRQVKAMGEAPQPAKQRSIVSILESRKVDIEKVLQSTGMNADRFIRVLTTEVRKSPKLTELAISNPMSMIAACMEMASLGLDPAVPNEVALVPYGSEIVCQPEYKGLAKLAKKSAKEAGAPLTTLSQFEIYENDSYEREYGNQAFCRLIPPPLGQPRGKLLGFVAVSEDENGMVNFVEMTVDEVKSHQTRFSKGAKSASSPFSNGQNFEAYGLKTVLRRLINRHLSMGVTWGDAENKAIEIEASEPITQEVEPIKEIEKQLESEPQSIAS